jgi:DNA-binding MarR family transcriptional regulator
MDKQLQRELSHDELSLSSPTPERVRAWRLFLESALALIDVLNGDFEREAGYPVRWYDVLVHLSEASEDVRMSELAERILYSKSGLTRIVDAMEAAGLVRRFRPENDRRSIHVLLTDQGRESMDRAWRHHGHWIEKHFSRPLSDADIEALIPALEKLSAYVRPLRPGRISS